MATKGKKGGKKKGQTLNLNEFLGGEAGGSYRPPGAGATATVEVGRGSNWADEMDDEGFDDRPKQQIVLPTAPRAALGPDIDDDRIPKRPPYTAYIANLPYDVDEEQIKEVFEKARLKIEQVRLMKDEGGRLRGYGYADFLDRDSLVDVLTMTDLAVNNRKMRIDLASQAGKERGGGFEDRGGERRAGREEDPNAGRSEADDWRSGPPPETRTDDRDSGRRGYNGRDSSDRDKGGSRGFSSYEPPRDRDGGGGRYGGFSRDRDGGRGGDRDGYSRDSGREREAPKERPKLSLAPRSEAKKDAEGGAAQSSIFGGAKPVDTVKKEKEIEEKLHKEKEEKEKAQEEARKNRPSAASIFGGAKPVDTTRREKEMEDKLSKMTVSKDADKKEERPPVENSWRRKDDGGEPARGGAYRPPGRREDGDRRDDRGSSGYDRDKRDDRGSSGYDRDRRDDRGSSGYDRDRRDDRGQERDRRDDRGSSGYDRDRKDDRGYDRDRRDDRGSSSGYDRDRRDERGSSSGYDRDRRDDRGSESEGKKDDHNGRDQTRDDGNNRDDRARSSGDKEATPEPPALKKYEEPKPADVVATNKFAFLEEEGAGSGSGEEN